MTRFNKDGSNMTVDPFENAPDCRPIYNLSTPEAKYPTGRALAAAFWLSYFAMHWLLLLEVIELTSGRVAATFFFFLVAGVLTFLIAARDNAEAIAREKKK